MLDVDSKVSMKNLYKEVWKCRDFEISHLWQRSVFLAVFLLAIAGAYGKLVFSIWFPEESKVYVICSEGKYPKDVDSVKICSQFL